MSGGALRREADIERVRALAAASASRIAIVSLPSPGVPRFVLDLEYATAGTNAYPAVRQPRSRLAIDLAPRYPFQPPSASVLTPVFHPNVYPSGLVCLGAKWLPSEGMDLFVRRVVRLLAFDPLLVNVHSFANSAALHWYLDARHRHPRDFPTDAAAVALGEHAAASQRVVLACPHCTAQLRLPAGKRGTVRCPRCRREFDAET
jgi:hypothetical protein